MKFLILFMSMIIFIGCKPKSTIILPEIKNLTEAVYASGNIYPKAEYKVYANADGLLDKVYIEEGDSVLAGQPLFKVESDMQAARSNSTRAVYSTAKDNFGDDSPILAEAKALLETAKNKMENDSLNHTRFKNLFENNATSQNEYEKTLLAYNNAKNEFRSRKSALEKLKKQLFVEMKNAESQYKVTQKEESNYLIKSQFDGIVYEIYKEKGEAVRRNDPIAHIGDNTSAYIKLNIDELDIEKIKPGQEVLVKVDLFKDKIFKAKITRIYKKLNERDQSFRVDAEFTGEKPSSYYGLTVEANVVVSRKENILVVPKNVMIGNDSLLIKKDGGEHKVRIQKGIEDFDYVEVLGGIDKNTEIVSGKQ